MQKPKFKLLYGAFEMFLFFGIWICYVRTIFFSFYILVTIMVKQANILAFSPVITDTLTY